MSKLFMLAVAAPLLLIGAAYPDDPKEEAAVAPAPAATYRPCRPGPGDDRCIQLYERGVSAAYARWRRDHGDSEAAAEVAMGGPDEPRARHAGGDGGRGDHDRCLDDAGGDGEARGM
jgi:hypothetical protein